MLILSIDSSGPACSVCIWRDGEILGEDYAEMERGQDAQLMPMILLTLARADLVFSAFDRIAVTRGPGSFTGVRVGLAAARGIGLACHKPVIGIDRFAIYHALHATPDRNLLVVIDSKRIDLFCRFFPANADAHDACLMTQEQINEFLGQQPNTVLVGDKFTPNDPVAATCALLAAQANDQDESTKPNPLYLRAPDVTLPDGTPTSAISL